VFTVSSDPVALGIVEAGALPAHVTGVHDDPPVDRLLEMAMRYIPGLTAVGIVYDPAQPNAVLSVEKLRLACRQQSIRLHEATAFSMTDLPAAMQSIVQRKAGALVLSADNLVLTGFPAILGAAQAAGLPIFTTDPDLVEQGATGAIGDDYRSWGAQAGRLAASVLAGVPPGSLPLETTRMRRIIEPEARPPDAAGGEAGRHPVYALGNQHRIPGGECKAMARFGLMLPSEFRDRSREHHED
jgi:ABC-type uncharacterized transport system substrate-binding protein